MTHPFILFMAGISGLISLALLYFRDSQLTISVLWPLGMLFAVVVLLRLVVKGIDGFVNVVTVQDSGDESD